MAETDGGIHAWMASIRASMASDPCRQLFEDQVQTHAFIFLDDYLENIIAGPKQGPIIELVKTPGRKKNARRTRAATAAAAKAQSIILLSLDDDSTTKENVPVNSFHKALLQAKERAAQDSSDRQKIPLAVSLIDYASSTSNGAVGRNRQLSKSVKIADVPEITVSGGTVPHASVLHVQQPSQMLEPQSSHCFMETQHGSLAPLLVSERDAELSVIAEGDESPERSRTNILPSCPVTSDHDGLPIETEGQAYAFQEDLPAERSTHREAVDSSHDLQGDIMPDGQHLTSSSVNTFHSIPLDSPQQARPSVLPAGNHTQPLPSMPAVSSPATHEGDALTVPLPVIPVSNSASALTTMFVPLNDSPPRTQVHKSSTPGFPTLPAPSPLRKSMRVPQEAAAVSVIPSTTPAPAPAPLGKRTSWLMKAREAKVMEGAVTRSSTLGNMTTAAVPSNVAVPCMSTAVKRKSGEMLGMPPYAPDKNGDQRKSKVAKSTEADIAPLISKEKGQAIERVLPAVKVKLAHTVAPARNVQSYDMDVDEQLVPLNDADGFIGQFKRTVEGLGARASKSMGKSLGGAAAAAALAEARAAAEARVAERNKVNGKVNDPGAPSEANVSPARQLSATLTPPQDDRLSVPTLQIEEAERRLSLSDLVPDTEKFRESKSAMKTTQVPFSDIQANKGDESISTTPPNSPPSQRRSSLVKPAGPVFNKQPVFMPPTSKQTYTASEHPQDFVFNLPMNKFALPASMSLGVPARLTSPSSVLRPPLQGGSQVSAQSSQASLFSDTAFDQDSEVPAWMPSTQDTSYTVDSQPRDAKLAALDDDDDSWPLEEKLAAAEQGWRPFDFNDVDKEDTWSSLPTESQGPTRSLTGEKKTIMPARTAAHQAHDMDVDADEQEGTGQEQEAVEISDADEGSIVETGDLEEVAKSSSSTRVEKPTTITRSDSQMSMASTASSSQSQAGFFSQATKLVNSMLGGGKKTKPEVKSLQLAAAAAKRQHEEADRKAQRLKEMEARRQAALAKKAEGEKTRLLEEEKKIKEEGERRKREREKEENTDKRPLKPLATASKKAEDDTKKRKIAAEAEKKPEAKKLPSKEKKDVTAPSKLAKPSLATPATKTAAAQKAVKANTPVLVSSAAYNASQNGPPGSSATKLAIPEAKPFKVVPSSLKGKAKAKPQDEDMGDKLPSTMIQSQMAARAKAQMQAAKQQTPEVPSESIELPDINSEYSDSEDEDRVRTFDPPEWAQSPELRQALQLQSTVNPDDIFGAIRPLRMEEMFRTRQSRFRARTSSANWSGSDRLTIEEIREYEQRMGFQPTPAS
ncbi:hypothetical protein BDN67DRAFT_940168 [Paxillus ammoniavirescens]|nr:hypothetical protein BDN67DRAFT_940168 [Paxillus ammoniavirescens]